MSEIVLKESYKNWISDLSSRYQRSQIKAAVSVNREMLMFYWSLGRDIVQMKAESSWGSGFYQQLSCDLRKEVPDAKGFSPRNLAYMKEYYLLFPYDKNLPQPVAKTDGMLVGEILPQVVAKIGIDPFVLPWGHIRLLIDRCKGNSEKAGFFIKQAVRHNWSRAVLMNFLDTDLYERQGNAVTNFSLTLPKPQSDLAQEMTRDPYSFDFLTIRQDYDEKALKDALMDNIQRFLLELGSGFAFLGREFRLVVGKTEQFLDMLFYHTELHCYVVIEVKARDFDPRDMGQLGTYVAAVDGILKKEQDGSTIGLLICKSKDNILAQYAVNAVNVPIGISEFDMNQFMPEKLKNALPTIEEIEEGLK